MPHLRPRNKMVPAVIRKGEEPFAVMAELNGERAPFDYELGERVARIGWPTTADALEDLPARIVRRVVEGGEAVKSRVDVEFMDVADDDKEE